MTPTLRHWLWTQFGWTFTIGVTMTSGSDIYADEHEALHARVDAELRRRLEQAFEDDLCRAVVALNLLAGAVRALDDMEDVLELYAAVNDLFAERVPSFGSALLFPAGSA